MCAAKVKSWGEIADWYDKKQGERGDLWHRTLIDPTLLSVIGDCRGSEVLDLGCGNGYLARRLARKGAVMAAVDQSAKMIKNAKAHDPKNRLKITYLRADAANLRFPEESFDLVFANMSLMDIEDAEGAVGEVARVLKRGGRFVASICHPCFDTNMNSGWISEKLPGEKRRVYRKVRGYRLPSSGAVPWRLKSGEKTFTVGFHRPLSWYARVLWSNGLPITALEEPEPTDEFHRRESEQEGDLDSPGLREVPLQLVIEARKIG